MADATLAVTVNELHVCHHLSYVRQATIRVRHRGEPESEISARHPDVTVRSVSSLTGRGSERKRIIELTGEPDAIESFLEEFRAADSILAAEALSPLGEPRVYVAMRFDVERWDSISERLTEMGVHYRMGTTISGGWERWTLFLGPEDDLSAVVAGIEAAGNDVELVREFELSEVTVPDQLDGDVERLLAELTPRQREALDIAIGTDYYGPDGEGTIETVADELGVATSTAWEHLTRAEEKLMGGLGVRLG